MRESKIAVLPPHGAGQLRRMRTSRPGDDRYEWLTTRQAITSTGLSERTLQNYAARGELEVIKRKVGTRHRAHYRADQVEALKARLRPPEILSAPGAAAAPHLVQLQLQPEALELVHQVTGGIAEALARMVAPGPTAVRLEFGEGTRELMVDVLRTLGAACAQAAGDVEHSPAPWLTVAEAAARSGLPVAEVRRLVAAGTVGTLGRGRGLRVRWRDLEAL